MKKKAKKEKKKWKLALTALCLLLIFCVSPFSKFFLSMGVMSVYSGMHEKESVLAEKKVELKIPGGSGRGWYPFVMTFNPNSADFCRFAALPEDAVRLSILYNFPAFDLSWGKGCSRLFDETSPYYHSFYGAYAVSGSTEGSPYGFHADGSLNQEEIAEVAKYDFQRLVLGDFGLAPRERVFTWTASAEAEEGAAGEASETAAAASKQNLFLGETGWQRVDADLLVNGCAHRADGFVQSYLQYGTPNYDISKTDDENKRPFIPVEMKGRIYAKYLEEKDLSVFFYIIAADEKVLEQTDEEILRGSKLNFR